MSRSCFWDRYSGHPGKLLANFSLSLVTVPEVFAKVNLAQFPSRFKSDEFISVAIVFKLHLSRNLLKCRKSNAELYYRLGSLSNHEDDGSDNVAKKMNMCPSKPAS